MPANLSNTSDPHLSFSDTEIAFRHRSNPELNLAYWLFRAMNSKLATSVGMPASTFALQIGIPIKSMIKNTIFRHFCGGETIAECEGTITQLASGKVGTILDYSVEGAKDEAGFRQTTEEIARIIERAEHDNRIPFAVFKITGVARLELLAKVSSGLTLIPAEEAEYLKAKARVNKICRKAFEAEVPVMIDAEETWIQNAIDSLALEMMRNYNREKAIVYNTYQLYRNDKLASLKADLAYAKDYQFILGAKLVRGAYLEKERERADELKYPSPINPDKESTDHHFNEAVKFCVEHIDRVSFVAGTHNEKSCLMLTQLMRERNLPENHPHIHFSQLLGMSDNLSFNLAHAGFNVAKYVPYGPVKAVMPYLFRRAQENKFIAGQTGRELRLIVEEKKRRRII